MSSYLSMRADEYEQAQIAAQQRRLARRPAPQAIDPERCKSPGRTLTRPAWWPEEDPAWHGDDPFTTPDQPSHRATRGKKRGGLCPDCNEQRSRTGVCFCGSMAEPITRGRNRVVVRRQAPKPSVPPWALAHLRMHARPVDGCQRCEVVHEELQAS